MAPREVRLIPEPDSLYEWDYLPERQHLFQKQISKHNIAACKEIAAGIGESIYAVSRGVPRSTTVETQVTGNALYQNLQEASKSRSFSSIVMELTERTRIQSSQLTEARKLIEERDDTIACLRTQNEEGERRIVEFEQQIATALARFRDFQHCVNTFQDDIMSVLR